MYVYQSSNPCLCSSTTVPPTDPPCPDDCNCLRVCSVFINPSDDRAVGPCAKTGTLDMMNLPEADVENDFCACGEDAKVWTLEYKDTEVFVTATITRAGVLTWITAGPEVLTKGIGEIILKVCCGPLSIYTQVLIGVSDPCDGCPDCGDCEVPDPCTCICAEAAVDIFLNTVPQSGNTILE